MASLFLWLAGATLVQAKGRRPEEDKDSFPDYNRLDIQHTKPPSPAVQTPPKADKTPVVAVPVTRTAPAAANSDLDTPKPPPTAVPMNRGDDTEPSLPDLVPTTTSQAPNK